MEDSKIRLILEVLVKISLSSYRLPKEAVDLLKDDPRLKETISLLQSHSLSGKEKLDLI